MKRVLLAIVFLSVVVIIVLRVIQASNGQEPPPDVEEIRALAGVPVEVVRVELAPLEVRRSFTGGVRGIRGATVRAGTEDEINEILVRVGQAVGEGDVVIRQSSRGSKARVDQAEAAHDQAQRTVDRLRPLRELGALSEQDWDNAITAFRVAEANLESARRAIVLTSPIQGVVTDILVTPGSFPGQGDPLVRISDLSSIQVLLHMSPGQRAGLAEGQMAILPASGREGRVTRIAMQADPDNRLVEVEVTFSGRGLETTSGSPGGLMAGALTIVEIVVGTRDEALLVPPVALHDQSVWVVDEDGTARLRETRVGLRGSDQVEVLEGLREGEMVVTAGASLLSEGARARIVGGGRD